MAFISGFTQMDTNIAGMVMAHGMLALIPAAKFTSLKL